MTVKPVKINSGELVEKLRVFSKEMEMGSVEALYGIKELVGEYKYKHIEVSRQVEPRTFAVIWLLQELIGEVWRNLGKGTTGFPKERGARYTIDISKGLGQFVQESLFRQGKPMEALIYAIANYFALLRLIDEEVRHEGVSATTWSAL